MKLNKSYFISAQFLTNKCYIEDLSLLLRRDCEVYEVDGNSQERIGIINKRLLLYIAMNAAESSIGNLNNTDHKDVKRCLQSADDCFKALKEWFDNASASTLALERNAYHFHLLFDSYLREKRISVRHYYSFHSIVFLLYTASCVDANVNSNYYSCIEDSLNSFFEQEGRDSVIEITLEDQSVMSERKRQGEFVVHLLKSGNSLFI
jgi:hypothetical protein